METTPTQTPPTTKTGSAAALGTSEPRTLSSAEEAITLDGSQNAAPTLTPPSAAEFAAGVGEITATVWHTDKRVTALWAINQNRNSWMGTNDAGWQKLANNSDTAIVAMTILASNARDANSSISYRTESDGMVHEMYVW